MRNDIPRELAPCGVFCGACPSLDKSCLGCASQDQNQKRKSKWNCKIRQCCYDDKALSFCVECEQFPCGTINKKLIESHPGEVRFKYRHEIPQNLERLQELGLNDYLEYQKGRWSCPDCSGRVMFYEYKCSACGKETVV